MRARLRELNVYVVNIKKNLSIFKSLLQDSPQLQTLRLTSPNAPDVIPILGEAFVTGCLKTLHTLEFDLWLQGKAQATLPMILTPLKQGCAPNLKELSLSTHLADEHIDLLEEFFPFLSAFDIERGNFSEGGKATLLQAAEKHVGLTLVLK